MKLKGSQAYISEMDGVARRLFPPRYPTETQAKESILMMVRREPHQFGHSQSRWSLKTILQSGDWLRLKTEGGLSQLLKRLGIRFKRGRSYVHSPDPHYMDKVSYLTLCRMRAWYAPERYVFMYLDEVTFNRQPSLDRAYEASGHHQAFAYRSHKSDTQFRGIGALNAITGQVTYRQYSKIRLPYLSDFYAAIRADYPDAETIYVAQDNWPVHVHPDVVCRLQSQYSPFWPNVPSNWPLTARSRAIHDDLPIQMVFLPTYASWLNPIEKLWRWLRQDVLHLHPYSDDWQALKQAVSDFIAQFSVGSTQLLNYVGLLYD
jgi:transposase